MVKRPSGHGNPDPEDAFKFVRKDESLKEGNALQLRGELTHRNIESLIALYKL